MDNYPHQFISSWRNCRFDSPPYFFDGDQDIISGRDEMLFCHSFDEYIARSDFGKKNRIHVGLLPIPYIGNLDNATIFVLMMNPGFSPGDYFAEQSADYREAYIKNIYQENAGDEYPFMFLNPNYSWSPGSTYWEPKLRSIAEDISQKKSIDYRNALRLLAKQIVCLELIPYHAQEFNIGSLIDDLPSAIAVLKYVHEVLVPKAQKDMITIVVTRRVKDWDLPDDKNIIKYKRNQSRAAHLSIKSPGGKAIRRRLDIYR
jgi:hypothetical protein